MKYSPKFEIVLKELAKEHRTTPETVVADMEALIEQCWNDPDPVIHARWVMIGRGRKPTVEQLVLFASGLVENA